MNLDIIYEIFHIEIQEITVSLRFLTSSSFIEWTIFSLQFSITNLIWTILW